QRILADQLGRIRLIFFVAKERHFDLCGVFDHVVVCEDEAVLAADDEAGAGRHCRLLTRARRPAALTSSTLTAWPPLPSTGLILILVGTAEEAMQKVVGRLSAAAEEI